MNNVRAEANRKKRTAKGKGKGVASPKSPRKVRGDERMPYLGGFYDDLFLVWLKFLTAQL